MTIRQGNQFAPAIRFTDRVANYIAYRPKYPTAVVDFLRRELGLTHASVIADIGSGTGILSEMFLQNGNIVFGVEPNDAMRAAAEDLLRDDPNFRSLDASAEATTLDDDSVDFVTAGQAFHWFDVPRARAEFKRILKPQGAVVLIWNMRRLDSTPFLRDYERLLRAFGTDYAQVGCEHLSEEELRQFFGYAAPSQRFDNQQAFDYEGLRGRLLSSSYAPLEGHPNHQPMLGELRRIFDAHQINGQVVFEYDTRVYYGQIVSDSGRR